MLSSCRLVRIFLEQAEPVRTRSRRVDPKNAVELFLGQIYKFGGFVRLDQGAAGSRLTEHPAPDNLIYLSTI
jgi:hypothetical protein